MISEKHPTSLVNLVADGHFKTKDEMTNYILLKVLHFESFEEQKNDRLDFKEVGIVNIKDVIDAVYLAGQMSVKQ